MMELLLLTLLFFSAPTPGNELPPDAQLRPAATPVAAGGDFLLIEESFAPPARAARGGDFSLRSRPAGEPSPEKLGGCPCQASELIFTDGFESGGTGAWTLIQN